MLLELLGKSFLSHVTYPPYNIPYPRQFTRSYLACKVNNDGNKKRPLLFCKSIDYNTFIPTLEYKQVKNTIQCSLYVNNFIGIRVIEALIK